MTIEGPGFKLDRSVDGNVVTQITALIFGGGGAGVWNPPPGRRTNNEDYVNLDDDGADGSQLGGGRATDQTLGEYLAEMEPKTVVDKITAVGEFLYLTRSTDEFTMDDFKEALKGIRDDIPGNVPRDFGSAVQSRYIAKVQGSDKEYRVTRTGRAALENHFPRAPRKRSSAKASK